MTDFTIRTECRLCAAPLGSERVLDLGSTALANEYPRERGPQDTFPLYLQQCGKCGHVQLPVVVKPERLFPADYPYKSGTSPVFLAHLREFAESVNALGPHVLMLDIASNDGSLVREFRRLGLGTWGIDPAAPEGEPAQERGFFTHAWAKQKREENGAFGLITALNVFAHVDDLNDFTAGVAALLPEDGLFVLEVGYLPDVIERGLFDVVYHEHLSYHHLRPLHSFFRKHGMSLVDAHRVDSQGGSIRCFARNGTHPPSGRLMALTDAEDIDLPRLARAAETLRYHLMVTASMEPPPSIAGFGAPAKLTTLLAATGAMPSVIYDDNPAKVGRYTPGTQIPIVSSAQLLEDQPDYVIIFSWNFADEVMARFPGFRGKWIIPLPEFMVVDSGSLQAAYDDTWDQFANDGRLSR